MSDLLGELRESCAEVARRARQVRLEAEVIPGYAARLPLEQPAADPDRDAHLHSGTREQLAAFWLTLNAVNFGSGWFRR